MKRRIEIISTWVLLVLCVVLLGGFSLVMNTLKEKEFIEKIYPLIDSTTTDLSDTQVYQQFKTMGMWFGLTLMGILVLMMLGLFFLSTKYWWVSPALYTAAGLVLLFGTQFLFYPIAFFFFVLAGVAFVQNRKLKRWKEEEREEKVS